MGTNVHIKKKEKGDYQMKKVIALMLVMMLVISGCGSKQSTSTPSTTPDTAPSTDSASSGDTVVVTENDKYDAVQEYKAVYPGEVTTLKLLNYSFNK